MDDWTDLRAQRHADLAAAKVVAALLRFEGKKEAAAAIEAAVKHAYTLEAALQTMATKLPEDELRAMAGEPSLTRRQKWRRFVDRAMGAM